MVHCQMSALGHVVGGAETVVRALLDAFFMLIDVKLDELLIVPIHNKCS